MPIHIWLIHKEANWLSKICFQWFDFGKLVCLWELIKRTENKVLAVIGNKLTLIMWNEEYDKFSHNHLIV